MCRTHLLFHRRVSGTNRLYRILSENSYGVYIFHLPILVVYQYALDGIELGPFAKFILAAILGVVTSYALTYVLRRFAVMRKVI
ncbi:acyltransferase family protein [Paenibacillus hexagrammi]|uniref:acyltransferase family protein n=1 Tax=Paenibacillus hexagrammi TaxID=2908839 RepID=UPI003312FF0B